MTDTAPEVEQPAPELPALPERVTKALRFQPSQGRSRATLDKILVAATEHYAEVGRDEFSISAVQAKSGVSVGTIYRYFKNRVNVLDAVAPDRESDTPAAKDPDENLRAALADMKTWATRLKDQGEGKGDLKAAGEALLKILAAKGL